MEFDIESALQFIMKSIMLEKYQSHDLLEFAFDLPLEGGLDETFGRP